jgi:hypothetical protein
MWYRQRKACDLTLENDEIHVITRDDGGYVMQVQFYDSTLNCADICSAPQDRVYLTVRYLDDTNPPATMCRRVRPGCPPPQE